MKTVKFPVKIKALEAVNGSVNVVIAVMKRRSRWQ